MRLWRTLRRYIKSAFCKGTTANKTCDKEKMPRQNCRARIMVGLYDSCQSPTARRFLNRTFRPAYHPAAKLPRAGGMGGVFDTGLGSGEKIPAFRKTHRPRARQNCRATLKNFQCVLRAERKLGISMCSVVK